MSQQIGINTPLDSVQQIVNALNTAKTNIVNAIVASGGSGGGDTDPKSIKFVEYNGTFADIQAPTETELENILGTPSTYPSGKVICINAYNIGTSGSFYIIVTNGDNFKHVKVNDESSKFDHVNLANKGFYTHAVIDNFLATSGSNADQKSIKFFNYDGTFADIQAPTETELENILGSPATYPNGKVICINAYNIGASGSLYIIVTRGSNFKHVKVNDESSKFDHENLANKGVWSHTVIDNHIDGAYFHVRYFTGTIAVPTPTQAELEAILGPAQYAYADTLYVVLGSCGVMFHCSPKISTNIWQYVVLTAAQ